MKLNQKFNLKEIPADRTHLMGLAALWIAFFHSLHLNFYQPWLLAHPHLMDMLNRLQESGNCGVDIFLFLSGLGLVYSWTRPREGVRHPVLAFYGRRLSRVLPPVLAVSVIYYGITGTQNGADWLGKVFFYGQFSTVLEGGRYWYFTLLLMLYFLFPLIWKAVDRGGLPAAAGLILLCVVGTMGIKWWISEDYFGQMEIMLTRIPIFILGVYFGKCSREEKELPGWVPALCLPLAILIWYEIRLIPEGYYYLRRFAYAPLTLCIVLAHAWLSARRLRGSFAERGMERIGRYSLEIYLIYEDLYLMNPLSLHSPDAVGLIYAGTTLVIALLLSALLRTALDALRGAARK